MARAESINPTLVALDPFKNFAKCIVSTGYDASATEIVLETGHGARLPAASHNCVWWNATDYPDPADDPNREIVRVTAKSTDTLTVTRAQEGTSASTKNEAGKTYLMIAAVTAKTLTDIETDIAAAGTKEFFVPHVFYSTGSGSSTPFDWDVGDFPTVRLASGHQVRYVFKVPHDFTTLVSASIIIIPDTTETIQYDVRSDYGAAGQSYNTHSGSQTDQTLSVTVNVLTELEIAGILGSLAAGDYVGIVLTSDTSNIQPLGLRLRYT